MRKLVFVLLTLALAAGTSLGQSSLPVQPKYNYFQLPADAGPDDYWHGKVLMKLKPQYRPYAFAERIDLPPLQAAMRIVSATRLVKAVPNSEPPSEPVNAFGQRLVDLSLIYELDFDPDAPIEDVVNLLLQTQLFEYVEPSYVYRSLYDPMDPDTGSQYYINQINARQAWDISKGDTTVVIGIVDTGCSFTHPDLSTEYHCNLNDTIDGIDNDNDGYVDNYRGWDFGGDYWNSPGDNDPTYFGTAPASDHGVLVSGPAAAATDNNNHIASIGFNCRLLPVKVSIDGTPLIYRGYQGVIYAAAHGADIINLSWGGTLRSRFGEDAINYATVNEAKMVVAAAGNTPLDLAFYPASYHNVLSCGGTEINDKFWLTDPGFGTTYHHLIDVCAPSRSVLTTATHNSLFSATGTSLGAPIACAVGGLVKAHFPNYTNAQVAQRVRATAWRDIYLNNGGIYLEKMGRGEVDAYAALTMTTPSVRIVDWEFDDHDDGAIQVNDTIDVRVRFMNYLDPVNDVTVTLTTPHWGQFEIIHGTVSLGDMATLDTASTWLAPFKVRIRPGASPGFLGDLRFEYTAPGYDDVEYIQMRVQPTYVHLDANRIETTIDGRGRWGYVNPPTLGLGKGLIVDGSAGFINDSGILIGNSSSKVSNNIENQNGGADVHFVTVTDATRATPGAKADLQAHTAYNDAAAGGNALDITVYQNSYQYDVHPDDNYIIQEYKIYNNSGIDSLHDVYAGMYFDLDMYWRSNNVSVWDTNARCIYNFFEDYVSLWNIGIALLTPDSLHGYAAHTDSFSYSIADKWQALTSHPSNANLGNINLVQFISAGPFSIAPNDTHTVAFAILAADSVHFLQQSVQRANDKYWCVIRGGMNPQVELGNDIYHCNGDTTFTLDAGSGYSSYEWNTGATTQTIAVDSSAEYWVKVTNGSGCVDHDKLNVTIGEGPAGGFTCSPQTGIFVGDTITFADTTQGVWEWGWDFGDGSNLCPIHPTVQHVYTNPGTYTVQMYVGNGVCYDTVTKVLTVDTMVAIDDPALGGGLTIYPNPAGEQLQVEWTTPFRGAAQLSIENSLGQIVRQIPIDKANNAWKGTLDVGELPRGVYFVAIRAGENREVRKLLLR